MLDNIRNYKAEDGEQEEEHKNTEGEDAENANQERTNASDRINL